MADIHALNGRQALIAIADRVRKYGEVVAPRGQETREIEHLTVEIADPYDALCVGINANQSREVIAAEALQLIGGFSDPKFAVEHAPALKAFLNDDGQFDGAYGPRIREQVGDLVARLKSDKDTRQAVLQIWERFDLARAGSKDYPCTLSLGFAIRHNKLNLSVTMRSNDVNWGFKNDIFQFTQLQCSIANVLGIQAGRYRHTAFSMHLYARDFAWAECLNRSAATTPLPESPAGIRARTVDDMQATAERLARGETVEDDYASHDWYIEALHG